MKKSKTDDDLMTIALSGNRAEIEIAGSAAAVRHIHEQEGKRDFFATAYEIADGTGSPIAKAFVQFLVDEGIANTDWRKTLKGRGHTRDQRRKKVYLRAARGLVLKGDSERVAADKVANASGAVRSTEAQAIRESLIADPLMQELKRIIPRAKGRRYLLPLLLQRIATAQPLVSSIINDCQAQGLGVDAINDRLAGNADPIVAITRVDVPEKW